MSCFLPYAICVQLDLSSLYSEWMCQQCEHQMRNVQQLRFEFLRVDTHWKLMLAQCLGDSKPTLILNEHLLKNENDKSIGLTDPLESVEKRDDPSEHSKDVPIDFIECKLEPDGDSSDLNNSDSKIKSPKVRCKSKTKRLSNFP